MHTPRSEFFAGLRGEAPILLGVLPFGMVYGAATIPAGLDPATAQAMSAIVFAGSAQFVITQMLEDAAPLLVIFATACLLNLRHILYSASVAPHVRHLPQGWRWLLSYLLTDEAYAVTIAHYTDETVPLRYKHWYFLGAGLALWSTWQLSTLAGLLLGAAVPPSWSLDFAIPLTFIALVVPALRDAASGIAALTAGVLVLLLAVLPLNLGLLVAALAGMLAGMLYEAYAGAPAAPRPDAPEYAPDE
jgi:4-azaleucine resistance transporter AzlC